MSAYTAHDKHRFWSKVIKGAPDACWPWVGSVTPKGYGQIYWEKRYQGAHRVALYIAVGHPPKNSPYAMHSCDNPNCCNPKHLRWGSPQDNQRDCVIKRRKNARNIPRKISLKRAAHIKYLICEGYALRRIAITFAITTDMLRLIRRGKTWRDIPVKLSECENTPSTKAPPPIKKGEDYRYWGTFK